jgi:trehalose 6-phosphate phosphatase
MTLNAKPAEERWAFFFDFDGTLVEIAERPDVVAVPKDLSFNLAALSDRLEGALAIISGRQIAEIDALLSPYRFDVAGVHGTELRLKPNTSPAADQRSEEFEKLLAELQRRFGSAGLLVEDKGVAAAVHWRSNPEYEADVVSFMKQASRALPDQYRLQLGKAVAEILPASSSKAQIIERILSTRAYEGRTPVFFGDDLTDEGGFEFVNQAGGISVRIGAGLTCAGYRLPSVASLRSCLAGWAEGAPLEPGKDLGS